MNDIEWKIISEFLIDNIPLVLDMNKNDLKFDQRSMYYKIYKYIIKLREGDKDEWEIRKNIDETI